MLIISDDDNSKIEELGETLLKRVLDQRFEGALKYFLDMEFAKLKDGIFVN